MTTPTEKKRVLLADPDHRGIARVSARLWEADFIVDSASTDKGALLRLREFSPHVLVAAVGSSLDGEDLCRQSRRAGRPITILVYPADCPDPARRSESAGADGFLLAPLDPCAVLNCVRWAVRLREASALAEGLARRSDERVLAPDSGSNELSRLEFEFYKRFLLMELRRSHRYHYPLAFLVVGIDRFRSTVGRLQAHERSHLGALILQQINETIREIDLAAAEGDERFHVCLPQTDFDGARQVAERLHERLPRVGGGTAFTVSVGISTFGGTDAAPTFKDMLGDAYARLERARALGGDRVISHQVASSGRAQP